MARRDTSDRANGELAPSSLRVNLKSLFIRRDPSVEWMSGNDVASKPRRACMLHGWYSWSYTRWQMPIRELAVKTSASIGRPIGKAVAGDAIPV
jgi:hypothetical protein